jgi:D-alanine-D-alanine ligase
MNRRYKVALLANTTAGHYELPPDAPEDALAEVDDKKYIPAYEAGIRAAGCDVITHEGAPDLEVIPWLREHKPDICFNVCEGFYGESREAHMPAILETMGIKYSGPPPLGAAVSQDKPTTKRILEYYGLPTPLFQVFRSADEPLDARLAYPLFVKPQHEGTGMGIKNDSVARTPAQLRQYVRHVVEKYRQPALVESFVEGRDITCGLIGNGDDVFFLPTSEVDYSAYPEGLENIYDEAHKNGLEHFYKCHIPALITPAQTEEVKRLTLETFRVTGCRDYCRVDFRLTPEGNLSILEINGLPGITPRSDLTLMAAKVGISHAEMVAMVLRAALKRYNML